MQKKMTVGGAVRLSAAPDLIELDETLTVTAAHYEEVLEKGGAALDQLRSALLEVGFSAEELKTANLQIVPMYENGTDKNGNPQRIFTGFRYRHTLKLAFDLNMARLRSVLDAAARSGAEPEAFLRFTVKDKDALRQRLIEGAVRDAREKAIHVAKTAQVQLGEIIDIIYDHNERDLLSPTQFAGNLCRGSSREPEIVPEDIQLYEQITIVWEIV